MKIVIADDHAIVRSGFSMILNFQDDIEVIGAAADGRKPTPWSPSSGRIS